MKSKLKLRKETLVRLQDNQLRSIDGGEKIGTSQMPPPPDGLNTAASCCSKTCGGGPDDNG